LILVNKGQNIVLPGNMFDDTELWPFDSSSSSTSSARSRTNSERATMTGGRRRKSEPCDKNENEKLLSGNQKEKSEGGGRDPVSYSAFGVTISTFKGMFLVVSYNDTENPWSDVLMVINNRF